MVFGVGIRLDLTARQSAKQILQIPLAKAANQAGKGWKIVGLRDGLQMNEKTMYGAPALGLLVSPFPPELKKPALNQRVFLRLR